MSTKIKTVKNHYILCGAGRTGAHIIEKFLETETPFVIIEQDQDIIDDLTETFGEKGKELLSLCGDATEDELLEQAGISQARGLITALDDDKDNLFVILTARSLNAAIRIVARINNERLNREKFIKAGANKVVSTNAIGGLRMASEMIRPEVVRFLDQMMQASEKEKTLRFTELALTDIQTPALKALIEAHHHNDDHPFELRITDIGKYTGLLVVAIKAHQETGHQPHNANYYPAQKRYRFTPRGNEKLHPDDILVVIGTQEKLDEVLGQETTQAKR